MFRTLTYKVGARYYLSSLDFLCKSSSTSKIKKEDLQMFVALAMYPFLGVSSVKVGTF